MARRHGGGHGHPPPDERRRHDLVPARPGPPSNSAASIRTGSDPAPPMSFRGRLPGLATPCLVPNGVAPSGSHCRPGRHRCRDWSMSSWPAVSSPTGEAGPCAAQPTRWGVGLCPPGCRRLLLRGEPAAHPGGGNACRFQVGRERVGGTGRRPSSRLAVPTSTWRRTTRGFAATTRPGCEGVEQWRRRHAGRGRARPERHRSHWPTR